MSESARQHQMERSQSSRFQISYAARALIAFVLLAAFLFGIVPLASVTAGSLCNLDCCAGRAPHASGSCMKGSCQATLPTSLRRRARRDEAEKFCGLPRKIQLTSFALRRAKAPLPSSSDHVASLALESPCQPDCGGCASGFANSNRSRNSAAVAGESRPRPPTYNHLSDFSYHRIRILETQCRQGAPRGPPISFYLV
jgi:hypothetical protein